MDKNVSNEDKINFLISISEVAIEDLETLLILFQDPKYECICDNIIRIIEDLQASLNEVKD